MVSTIFAYALLASVSAIVNGERMFVADYTGKIHTVEFASTAANKGNLTLVKTLNIGAGTAPSWLFRGPDKEKLWFSTEGNETIGGKIYEYAISTDGTLNYVLDLDTEGAAVQASFVLDNSVIAAANYGGMTSPGTASATGGLTYFTFNQTTGKSNSHVPGAFAGPKTKGIAPQDVSHAHGVTRDPTERFFVVPDLGSDRLVVHSRENWIPARKRDDLEVNLPKGTGPRHAVFFHRGPGTSSYLFVVNEISNSIMTFNVTYGLRNGTLDMKLELSREISTLPSSFANVTDVLKNSKAAEIQVSPDNRLLTVSNRYVTSPEFQGKGVADSLSTFEMNLDGSLKLVQNRLIGISGPRSFDIHPAGDKIVVAGQNPSSVSVWSRDPATGFVGNLMAIMLFNTTVQGEVKGIPHAIWDIR